jgi:hypothetical protein
LLHSFRGIFNLEDASLRRPCCDVCKCEEGTAECVSKTTGDTRKEMLCDEIIAKKEKYRTAIVVGAIHGEKEVEIYNG